METFQEAAIQKMRQIALEMGMEGKGEDELDEILSQRATETPNIEVAVDELQTVLDYACQSSFRRTRLKSRKEPWHKSVHLQKYLMILILQHVAVNSCTFA
jgi:hypothetical protein